jgi:hypothetical protein
MEENTQVLCLVLITGEVIISKVEELYVDIGKPDCKLINPYILDKSEGTLSPWMQSITLDEEVLISSDKILTIVSPKGSLFDQYMEDTK